MRIRQPNGIASGVSHLYHFGEEIIRRNWKVENLGKDRFDVRTKGSANRKQALKSFLKVVAKQPKWGNIIILAPQLLWALVPSHLAADAG
jgi:hypothetical protein